jgi:Na+-transporting NADH:ubiquinone oxidoreductase subunit NqrF
MFNLKLVYNCTCMLNGKKDDWKIQNLFISSLFNSNVTLEHEEKEQYVYYMILFSLTVSQCTF